MFRHLQDCLKHLAALARYNFSGKKPTHPTYDGPVEILIHPTDLNPPLEPVLEGAESLKSWCPKCDQYYNVCWCSDTLSISDMVSLTQLLID